jgi:hypothetical protein
MKKKIISLFFMILLSAPSMTLAVDLPYFFKAEGDGQDCRTSEARAERYCRYYGGSCYSSVSSLRSGNRIFVLSDNPEVMAEQNRLRQEAVAEVERQGFICKEFEATTRECLRWREGALCSHRSNGKSWSDCYCSSTRPSDDLLGTHQLVNLWNNRTEIPLPSTTSEPVPPANPETNP